MDKGTETSPFVIVSSEGMHEMAEFVQILLLEKGVFIKHHQVEYTIFKNLEVVAHIPETVRRQHVFFFHSLLFPNPNEAFMRMMIVCDALARASVEGITLVVPYISYLRQDRKDKPRVPITARLMADMIESNKKISDIITIDMHTEQAQGFFSIPVDNLSSKRLFATTMQEWLGRHIKDAVVAAPDVGSAKRARKFADALGGLPITILDKERKEANVSNVLSVIGESVAGKVVFMYDDMIDTGGTIINAAQALKAPPHSAREVHVMATHGIFSANAQEFLKKSGVKIYTTNSIPRPEGFGSGWLSVVSIDGLISDAIFEHMLMAGSISKLS